MRIRTRIRKSSGRIKQEDSIRNEMNPKDHAISVSQK
jgi:hypothetical protein